MQADNIYRVLQAAQQTGLLVADSPAAIFYDLSGFRNSIIGIQSVFPSDTLHTAAIKANPIAGLLREAMKLGMGAECASLPELVHAMNIGFPIEKIVFDSPAKTIPELEFAINHNIYINVDNLQELDRVATLAKTGNQQIRAGLRINPQTGGGHWQGSSTAIATSKFGIPLLEQRDRILTAFKRYPWLVGLHVHTGSQVCPLPLVVRGVQIVIELAHEIESSRGKQIEVVDIGGGLPVSYEHDEPATNLKEYISLLHKQVPDLFQFRIVTEFGRAISAKTGWAASRVEYTKRAGERAIAVVHFGADLFVRTALLPEIWHHRVTVHDANGKPKTTSIEHYNIAGPLCFSGDLVAEDRPLPHIDAGDFLIVHDAGAYTLSMWSRYNSRQSPPVYGYELEPEVTLHLLRAGETVTDVLRFWE